MIAITFESDCNHLEEVFFWEFLCPWFFVYFFFFVFWNGILSKDVLFVFESFVYICLCVFRQSCLVFILCGFDFFERCRRSSSNFCFLWFQLPFFSIKKITLYVLQTKKRLSGKTKILRCRAQINGPLIFRIFFSTCFILMVKIPLF